MKRTCPCRNYSVAILAVFVVALGQATAASKTYIGVGSGKWNTTTNWDPTGVPVAGDAVFLTQSSNKTITVDLNKTYGAPGLDSLLINANGTGTITLNSSKNLTVIGSETLGVFGRGSFNQNSGTHKTGGMVLGANLTTDLGTFTIKAGKIGVITDLVVGDFGQGVFTVRGGSAIVGGDLVVASEAGSVGSLALTDGQLRVIGSTVVGDAGSGRFTQSRGTSTHSLLVAGLTAGGNGTVTFSARTMNSAEAIIGDAGKGVFNQTGGTHNVAGDLSLGVSASGDGTYNLALGVLKAGGDLNVGLDGVGSVEQTGGSATVTGGVFIQDGSSYNLLDATLTAGGVSIGDGATFSVGGENNHLRARGDVSISENAAEVSTFDGHLVIVAGTSASLSVNGEDIGADIAGLVGGSAWRRLTLEKNAILALDGVSSNALYVDIFDVTPTAVFRMSSVVIGNGINIYYNQDNYENRYLGGGTYPLGNGGQLIPYKAPVEEEPAATP